MNTSITFPNLEVAVSQIAEKVLGAPVVIEPPATEPPYRTLEVDEEIRFGDQVWAFGRGPWQPVTPTEHGRKYHTGYYKMRRPVTPAPANPEQEYRMLELGETMEKGDESKYKEEPWKQIEEHGIGVIYENPNVRVRRPVTIESLKRELAEMTKDRDTWMDLADRRLGKLSHIHAIMHED